MTRRTRPDGETPPADDASMSDRHLRLLRAVARRRRIDADRTGSPASKSAAARAAGRLDAARKRRRTG